MLKLAGETDIGILDAHEADLGAHHRDRWETVRTGEYMSPYGRGGSALPVLADKLYAIPFVVVRAMTIDRLAIEVTVAGAAGTDARLGIYEQGTNLYPGTRLLDAGTVDVDSTGIKVIVINQSLTKGFHWAVLVSNGAPTIRAMWKYHGYLPLGVQDTGFGEGYYYWRVDFTYAALPNPFTAGGSLQTGDIPMILPRVASLD